MKRILVDFNSMNTDAQRRVYIGGPGSAVNDQELVRSLCEGEIVLLDSGDLQVQATAEFDVALQAWLGRPDWATSRDLEPGEFAHDSAASASDRA